MLNKSGLKIDLCGTPDTISSQSLRTTQIFSLLVVMNVTMHQLQGGH